MVVGSVAKPSQQVNEEVQAQEMEVLLSPQKNVEQPNGKISSL